MDEIPFPENEIPFSEFDPFKLEEEIASYSPEDPFEQEDKEKVFEQILRKIFKRSPNKERNVVMMKMYFFEDKTLTEIAEEFRIKELSVRKIIERVETIRAPSYIEKLTGEERRRIMSLIKEYWM